MTCKRCDGRKVVQLVPYVWIICPDCRDEGRPVPVGEVAEKLLTDLVHGSAVDDDKKGRPAKVKVKTKKGGRR